MYPNTKPMYEQVYSRLIDQISSGHYNAGDRLPSEKDLSDIYNVSRITSKKALEKLASEGRIIRQRGKGSFVSEAINPTLNMMNTEENTDKRLLVGLVMPSFDNVYGAGIIRSIETEVRKNQGIMILKQTMGDIKSQQEAIIDLIDFGVNALIVMPVYGEYFCEEVLRLVLKKFPLVLIDRHLKGIPTISISTNNVTSTEKLVNYLFERGHSEIGLISSAPQNTTTIEDRIAGFVSAHEKKGIIPEKKLWLSSINSAIPDENQTIAPEDDVLKIMQHLQNNHNMTALFCIEYHIALLAEKAARQIGLQVPQDLEIICFDGIKNKFDSTVRFPFICQDENKIGEVAVKKLLDIFSGSLEPQQIFIEGEVVGFNTIDAS